MLLERIGSQILIWADTGEPVFLPFRMSCFVLSNLVVTAGMLTPGLGVSIPLQLVIKTNLVADDRNSALANNKPISQRRNQQRQRQQIHSPLYLEDRTIILPRSWSFLLSCTWIECPRSTIEASQPSYEDDPYKTGPLRRSGKCWCSECVPDARRGNQTRN